MIGVRANELDVRIEYDLSTALADLQTKIHIEITGREIRRIKAPGVHEHRTPDEHTVRRDRRKIADQNIPTYVSRKIGRESFVRVGNGFTGAQNVAAVRDEGVTVDDPGPDDP